MPAPDPAALVALERENTYLKRRVAQLSDDVTDLNSEITRLQQMIERLGARKIALSGSANPLSGGQ
jgi:predicted  nucleic acid-binding Zn-ribbon protein